MSVYVDDMEAPFGRMLMCHMFADTTEELLAMVDKIGVQRKWIQDARNPVDEHFDISKGKRHLAIHYGAIEISYPSETAALLERRKTDALAATQDGKDGQNVDP